MLDLLAILMLAPIFALIGYVRGRGMIPYAEHVVAPILWGIFTAIAAIALGYNTAYTIAIAIITIVGLIIWMIGIKKGWGGWGLYFASWTWEWDPNDSEVPWIDWIGFKLVPFVTPDVHWTNGLRGTICMSIRGLYITPLFFMLVALPLGILLGLSQGIVYGSMRWLAPTAGTKYAEPVYAALIGTAIAHCLVVGF